MLSHVRLFAIPWTVALQAPLSVGFSRQEYSSGLPFPSPGQLLDPGIKPRFPTLQADSLLSEVFPRILRKSTVRKDMDEVALKASLPLPGHFFSEPLSAPSLVFRWPCSRGQEAETVAPMLHGPTDAQAGIGTSPSLHLTVCVPELSLMAQECWLLSSGEKSQANAVLRKATVYYYLNK